MATARQMDRAATALGVATALLGLIGATACADRAPPAMWPEPPPPVLAEPLGQGPDDLWHAEQSGAGDPVTAAPPAELPGDGPAEDGPAEGEPAEGEPSEGEPAEHDDVPRRTPGAERAPRRPDGTTAAPEATSDAGADAGADAGEPSEPGVRPDGEIAGRGTVGEPRGPGLCDASFPDPRRPT